MNLEDGGDSQVAGVHGREEPTKGIRTRLILSLGLVVLGVVLQLAGGIAARLAVNWIHEAVETGTDRILMNVFVPSPLLETVAWVLNVVGAVAIGAGLIATVVVAYRWARDADQGEQVRAQTR